MMPPRACILLCIVSMMGNTAWPESPAAEAKPPEPPAKIVHDEHTVYIPYDELERVFEKEGRGVFLPYAEFIKLWEKGRPVQPPKPKPEPPFDSAIAASSYEGVITGDAASFTATYTVEMLKDEGWSALPLPLNGVAVTESSVEGGQALLTVADKGYELLMGAPGVYRLTVKFVTRVERQPGKNLFSFACPRAAVSRLQVALPGRDLGIEVQPMLVASATESAGDQTLVQAFLGSTDRVTFQWWPKTVEKAREEALLFARTHLRVSVREGSLLAEAALHYDILRAPVDQFEVLLPADVKVVTVEGANLKDWNVQAEGDRQKVRATLHGPEKKAYSLKVSVERSVDAFPAQLGVPEIVPAGAAREIGMLSVTKSDALDIKVKERSGLSQLAAEDLPEALRSGNIFFAGSYVAHPFSLVLTVALIEPKVSAEAFTRITLLKESLLVHGTFRYHIRKAGLFRLRFRLPAPLEIRQVGDEARVEDYSAIEEGGVKTVTVTLASRAFGDFTLPIVGEQARPGESGDLALPIPEILDVEREKGTIAVAVEETLEAKISASQNVTPLGLQEIQKEMPTPPAPAEARTVFGFQYVRRPASVTLNVEKRKPQATARVESHLHVDEGAVKLKSLLSYTIRYAGISELSFSVPSGLGDELRITGPNIKEKVRSPAPEGEPPADRWRVTLQSEALGEYPLTLEYEAKLKGVQKGEVSLFQVPEIVVNQVARENGYFAVTKDVDVEVDSESQGLEEIDARELAGTSLASTGAFLAFKYLDHPYALKLKVTLPEYVGVVQTLVNEAYLESVFSKHGGLMTDARFLVQNNQRPLIPVTLPDQAEVRSLFVDGKPERPRQGEKGQLLIPVANVGQTLFQVRMVYELPAAGGEMGWAGALEASAPSFPEDVPVLRLLWDTYAPSGYEYLWLGGNMQAVEQRVRGWENIKEVMQYFTPRLSTRHSPRQEYRPGPQAASGSTGPSAGSGVIAVEFPREGIRQQFTKLSGNGRVRLPYLKSKLYVGLDILFFLAAVILGLRCSRRWSKARVALSLAAAAVLLASFLPASLAGWLDSVFWGAVVLGAVWAVPPIFRKMAEFKTRWQERRAEKRKAREQALKDILPPVKSKKPQAAEEKPEKPEGSHES